MATPVLELIERRHHSGSLPGKRHDSYKLALCIEGGGMRGIVSSGGAMAIERLGMLSAFDVIYGSSAGAYSGAYILSGKPLEGAQLWLNYLNSRRFVSLWRYFTGGTLFDLDYARKMMTDRISLDWKAIESGFPPLHIIATDVGRAKTRIFKNLKSKTDLFNALHASAQLPERTRFIPFTWKRHKYIDAGFIDPFGIQSALQEGCTHILVLFSGPWRGRRALKLVDNKLLVPELHKLNANLAVLYLNHSAYSVNGLSHIWNHYDGTHISVIAPKQDSRLPSKITINRRQLGYGFLAGADAALLHLAPDKHTKQLILESFRHDLHI